MRVRLCILATLLTLVLSPSVASQDKRCDLKSEQAPGLRGIKLGIPLSDVRGKFGSALQEGFANEETGEASATLAVFLLRGKHEGAFDDVSDVDFRFLDDKLFDLTIGYSSRQRDWKDISEFTDAISSALKLPGDWNISYRSATLDCDGFQIEASIRSISTQINLRKKGAEEEISRRKKAIEDKRKKGFRP